LTDAYLGKQWSVGAPLSKDHRS